MTLVHQAVKLATSPSWAEFDAGIERSEDLAHGGHGEAVKMATLES
jgi:hypothetical protein